MDYLLDTIHSKIEWIVDTLEIILIDAEAQKHFAPALVGFAMSEVKSRVTKLGKKMTRTEAFEKAWRLVAKEKDYSGVILNNYK